MRRFAIAAVLVAGILLLGCVQQVQQIVGASKCAGLNESCGADADCCGKSTCTETGAHEGTGVCLPCHKQLQPCRSDADCCENEICTGWAGYNTTVCILPIE